MPEEQKEILEKPLFPMRVNRALAYYGLATRRGADLLIQAGRVLLNGRRVVLGEKVERTDKLEILEDESHPEKEHVYIAYYKPRGIVTHSPQKRERAIEESSQFAGTFPVGRLDKESQGLIILTNDGRITDRLLHPRYAHEKEYRVTVREKAEKHLAPILVAGVTNEGELLAAKRVEILGPHTLSMVLTQGKKHQIRRMLSEVHLTVEQLIRVRIMGVALGALEPGQGRKLTGPARERFMMDLGLR